jgi:hypothetical protein
VPRRVLLALLTLGLLAAAAPAADAARPGVNIAVPSAPVVQRALDTGAAEVRFFVHWSTFEPTGPRDIDAAGPQNPRDDTFAAIAKIKQAGRRVMIVVSGAPAWANGGQDDLHPPTPDHVPDFARFAAAFVHRAATLGTPIDTLEVWNEPDGGEYWKPSPDAGLYTALLKATYAAVKDPATGDPDVAVHAGPTTGNNAGWIQALYDHGAKGSFDGVSVHTDTACLVAPPDSFYRDAAGRLAQFTFLGYREVRATMLANGDDKPIAMSELGWSSTDGGPTSCTRGTYAGQKPNGVSAAVQAAHLTAAYRCLANDPYVTSADWFTLADTSTSASDELGHYGLLDTGVLAKPALAAFSAVAATGGGPAGACGDFAPPTIRVISPAPGQQFVDKLDLRAAAADGGVGLARISFFADDASAEIRNFTTALVNDAPVGLVPWHGSGGLALGRHRIRVVALDKNGNQSSQVVEVEKVRTLAATLTPVFRLRSRKVACRRRACTVRGSLARGAAGTPSIGGKVAVEWQFRNTQGRWRKLVGGLEAASRPFAFTARITRAGRWRVRVVYQGVAPWRSAQSRYLYFRVR